MMRDIDIANRIRYSGISQEQGILSVLYVKLKFDKLIQKEGIMKKERFVKVRKFVKENKKPIGIIAGVFATGALAILSYMASEQGDAEKKELPERDCRSEEELREIEREMSSRLEHMDYDSDEYGRLYEEHCDVVNEINSRFSYNMPKRENGWYRMNDE